jgi:hypothetical protein
VAAAPSMPSAPATPMAARGAMAGARQANDAAFKAQASEAADAPPARERRAAAAPLGPALIALAAASGAQWTLPPGRSVAHGPLQQQWLGDVQRSTGAWQRADGAGPSASATLFVVRDGGSAVGSLWMEGATLWWRDARGVLFTAQAREDQVRAWINTAEGW